MTRHSPSSPSWRARAAPAGQPAAEDTQDRCELFIIVFLVYTFLLKLPPAVRKLSLLRSLDFSPRARDGASVSSDLEIIEQ